MCLRFSNVIFIAAKRRIKSQQEWVLVLKRRVHLHLPTILDDSLRSDFSDVHIGYWTKILMDLPHNTLYSRYVPTEDDFYPIELFLAH